MELTRGFTTDIIADQLADGRGKIKIDRVFMIWWLRLTKSGLLFREFKAQVCPGGDPLQGQ